MVQLIAKTTLILFSDIPAGLCKKKYGIAIEISLVMNVEILNKVNDGILLSLERKLFIIIIILG